MAFEIGDVMRAIVETSLPNDVTAINVWDWVRNDSESGSPFVGAVTDELATKLNAMYSFIIPDMSNVVTVVSATFYVMEYLVDKWVVAQLAGVEPLGLVGVDAGEMSPHGNAMLLGLKTAISKKRGRRFIPGLSEQKVDSGTLQAAVLGHILDMANEYLTDVTTTENYRYAPRLMSTTGELVSFTGSSASGYPAYQRRRKPGVGS